MAKGITKTKGVRIGGNVIERDGWSECVDEKTRRRQRIRRTQKIWVMQ